MYLKEKNLENLPQNFLDIWFKYKEIYIIFSKIDSKFEMEKNK